MLLQELNNFVAVILQGLIGSIPLYITRRCPHRISPWKHVGKSGRKAKFLTVQWTDIDIWNIINHVYNMNTREQTRTWKALNTHTIDIQCGISMWDVPSRAPCRPTLTPFKMRLVLRPLPDRKIWIGCLVPSTFLKGPTLRKTIERRFHFDVGRTQLESCFQGILCIDDG